jgi:hypothetical protein
MTSTMSRHLARLAVPLIAAAAGLASTAARADRPSHFISTTLHTCMAVDTMRFTPQGLRLR